MSVHKTVVTKANLQYYHGKLKRLIDNIGDVKGFKRADTTSVTRTDPLGEVYEAMLPDAVSDMKDTWYASSSIRTIQIQNYDQARGIDIADYQNPNNNVMRFDFYLGSGGAGHPANTIYKKAAVDAKFDAINGMSFKLIDPTQNLNDYAFIPDTLEKFLNKANYDYYDSEKPSPSIFKNQIVLYPVGDEYYEYVFIEGPNGFPSDDYEIEFVGSTKQDLTGYLKDEDIEATDNDYIDAVFVMDWAPGLYDSTGNMVKTWDELITEVDTGKAYLITDTPIGNPGALSIIQRTYPWPANGTILVLPDNIQSIQDLNYSGDDPMANRTIPLEAIFIPKKPDTWPSNSGYAGADSMTFYNDMIGFSYVPNLRWIAGEVSGVSYVVQDPNYTGTGSAPYIDACKFFQMF